MKPNRKFPRWVKLELEQLETREAPTVSPWTTLSFEGSKVGNLPLNWSQWSSDPNTSFSVTASPTPALSGTHSFSVTSGSGSISGAVTRSWLDETMPADVQVGAAVYINSLIPAQVIARGSNLNAPDGPNGPSFYAVEVTNGSSGPKLELLKDVNGVETTLASIQAPTYMAGQWARETLDVEGSTVRAQFFDPATGEYLNSAGQWQNTQTWALTVLLRRRGVARPDGQAGQGGQWRGDRPRLSHLHELRSGHLGPGNPGLERQYLGGASLSCGHPAILERQRRLAEYADLGLANDRLLYHWGRSNRRGASRWAGIR
jgi:hypothetical protein